MNNIPSLKFLFKKLGVFTIVFTTLILISSIDIIRKGHNRFYCSITNVIFNLMNPEIYAEFSTETRSDLDHFGIAIKLYDKKKYGEQQQARSKRRYINPDIIKYPNLHALVLVPIIFLISLFVVTPIPTKSKLVRVLIALLIFYICLVFYYSYVFSISLNNGKFELDSLWHLIIRLFGVDNAELINIFVIMIWAGLSVPPLRNQSSKKQQI